MILTFFHFLNEDAISFLYLISCFPVYIALVYPSFLRRQIHSEYVPKKVNHDPRGILHNWRQKAFFGEFNFRVSFITAQGPLRWNSVSTAFYCRSISGHVGRKNCTLAWTQRKREIWIKLRYCQFNSATNLRLDFYIVSICMVLKVVVLNSNHRNEPATFSIRV